MEQGISIPIRFLTRKSWVLWNNLSHLMAHSKSAKSSILSMVRTFLFSAWLTTYLKLLDSEREFSLRTVMFWSLRWAKPSRIGLLTTTKNTLKLWKSQAHTPSIPFTRLRRHSKRTSGHTIALWIPMTPIGKISMPKIIVDKTPTNSLVSMHGNISQMVSWVRYLIMKRWRISPNS